MTADRTAEISITHDPEAADIAFLDARIDEFNAMQTGFHDGSLLSIVLKDANGVIYAGLHGHTWGGCCEVKVLWVDERHRKRGLGTRILIAAEGEARQRGCRRIVLSSHSFQAPGFYEKLGYTRLCAVDDYPVGYANIVLVKQLQASAETQ